MAAFSGATPDDVTQGALRLVRRHTGAEATETDQDLLRRLGALRSDNRLSQAGRLLFASAARPLIELTVLDVHGGDVVNRVALDSSSSLLQQLDVVEKALETLSDFVVHAGSFAAESVRKVPPNAVPEAVLNGLIHRDWNPSEPTDVRWIQYDSTLVVRSPGGFTGDISADNVLSNRHARYSALADVFRSTARQKDYRIAIIVDALLHRPFLTLQDVANSLQSDVASAEVALQAAAQSTVDAEALIRMYKDVWVFGRSTWRLSCTWCGKFRTDFSSREEHLRNCRPVNAL